MPAEVATLAVGLVLNTGKFFAALGATLNTVTSKMTKWGMLASAAFTVPMVLGLKTVTNAAIDFETAFAGVIKTVDEATDEFGELTVIGEELRQIIRDMAKEIPVVPEELARIGELAGQLGVPIDMLEGFIRTIAMLSVTTDMTIESATMQIARFRNIMGTADQPIDQLASTIVHLGNNSATTESQIMNMAMRIAGAGKIIGLTETEILAMAAAMSSAGIRTEMGGTAISRVLIDMASAVEENDVKLKNLAAVAGVSVEEFARVFREDAMRALIMFVGGLKAVDAAGGDTFGVLETLEMADIRVRETLLKLMSAEFGLADALALANEGWDENTALVKEAEQRFKTTASQIQIFKNTLNDLWITIGEQVTPTIVEFLGRANEIIELVHDWVKINPELTKTFLMIAAAIAVIGPALLLFGKIILPLAAAIIGVALNPLVLAFAAVAFAIYKWVTATYHIKNLQDAVVAFADIAVQALDWVSERLVGMVDLIGRMAEWGAQAIGAFAQGIISGLGLVVQAINYVVGGIAALLGPGSPPAAMPEIVQWGQNAIDQFLRGMTMGDFDILDDVGDKIADHLRTLDFGGEEALSEALIRARVALARVVAEASTSGEASVQAWQDLREAIHDDTGELERYLRLRIEAGKFEDGLAQAELARKKASKRLEDEKYAIEIGHKRATRQLEEEGHATELRHKEELRVVDEKVKTAEEALANFREQSAEIPERFTRGRRRQLEVELRAAQKERDSVKDRQEIERDEFETRKRRIGELQKIERDEFEIRKRRVMEEVDAQVEAAKAKRNLAQEEADWLEAVIMQKQKIIGLYKEEKDAADGFVLPEDFVPPEIGDAIGGIKDQFDKAKEAAAGLFGVWRAFWAGLTGVPLDEELKKMTGEERRMYQAGLDVNEAWEDFTDILDKVRAALQPIVDIFQQIFGGEGIEGEIESAPLEESIDSLIDRITFWLEQKWPKINAILNEWAERFWGWVSQAVIDLDKKLTPLLDTIEEWAYKPETQDRLVKLGHALGQALVDAMVWLLKNDAAIAQVLMALTFLLLETLARVLAIAIHVGWDIAVGMVSGILEKLDAKNWIPNLKQKIVEGLEDLGEAIKKWLLDLPGKLAEALGGVVGTVAGAFTDLQFLLVGGSIIPDMIAQIEGAFGQMGQNVAETGTQMVQGLTTGLTGGVPALAGALAGAGTPGAVAGGFAGQIVITNYWDASLGAKDRSELAAMMEDTTYRVLGETYGG